VPVIVAARFFPSLYLYAGSTELMTETALCLTFIVASLLVATLSDVHRRKEDELNEFRSRVESLVNNSPNMMSLKGLDGRFLLANRAYSRMLGVTEYAMVGRGGDYFAPEDARRIQQQDEVVLNCLEPRQFEKASASAVPPSPCW
jgi:PAS domain-containing protein